MSEDDRRLMLQDDDIFRIGGLGRLVEDFDLGFFIDRDGLQRLRGDIFGRERLQIRRIFAVVVARIPLNGLIERFQARFDLHLHLLGLLEGSTEALLQCASQQIETDKRQNE
jgi:hypothetical protein